MTEMTLARLKELAEKATPGPWHTSMSQPEISVLVDGGIIADLTWATDAVKGVASRNAEFIAAANPLCILALIKHTQALEETLTISGKLARVRVAQMDIAMEALRDIADNKQFSIDHVRSKAREAVAEIDGFDS